MHSLIINLTGQLIIHLHLTVGRSVKEPIRRNSLAITGIVVSITRLNQQYLTRVLMRYAINFRKVTCILYFILGANKQWILKLSYQEMVSRYVQFPFLRQSSILHWWIDWIFRGWGSFSFLFFIIDSDLPQARSDPISMVMWRGLPMSALTCSNQIWMLTFSSNHLRYEYA